MKKPANIPLMKETFLLAPYSFAVLSKRKHKHLSALRKLSYGKAVYLVGIKLLFSGIIDKTPYILTWQEEFRSEWVKTHCYLSVRILSYRRRRSDILWTNLINLQLIGCYKSRYLANLILYSEIYTPQTDFSAPVPSICIFMQSIIHSQKNRTNIFFIHSFIH